MFENCRYKEYLGLDNSFQQLSVVFREEFHAVLTGPQQAKLVSGPPEPVKIAGVR